MTHSMHQRARRSCRPPIVGALRQHLCAAALVLMVATGACAANTDRVAASVDGHDWLATRDFYTATQIGAKPVLSLTAFQDAKPLSRFTFNLFVGSVANPVGTYTLGQGSPTAASHGTYAANAGADADPMEDSYRFIEGSVVIAGYDAATRTVSGTFAGKVRNHSGKTLTISGGSFGGVGVSP